MNEESRVRQLIRESGLTAGVRDALESMLLPSVRLRSQPADESTVPLGTSKLGGMPDMLPDLEWPERHGTPLAFIAQINLTDVAPFDLRGDLPSVGLLLFFYDADEQPWGFDPDHRGSWRVLYQRDPLDQLRRIEPPETIPEYCQFPVCRLSYRPEMMLPPIESPLIAQLGLDVDTIQQTPAADREILQAELGRLLALVDESRAVYGQEDVKHRLLGHADPIQGDMQTECQLASHGVYLGNATGYQSARAVELRPGAVDWRLLLQIDSDDSAQMMWGDAGRIYFWIPSDALICRDFEQAWLVLQCY